MTTGTFESLSEHSWRKTQGAARLLKATGEEGPTSNRLSAVCERYVATSQVVRLAFDAIRRERPLTADDADNLYKLWWWRWRLKDKTRREAIEALRLPPAPAAAVFRIIEELNERSATRGDPNGTIGCWGTGKGTLRQNLSDPGALAWYVGLLSDVADAPSREAAYDAARGYLDDPIKGMAAGVLSPTLYCLRPTDFPVLNGPVVDVCRKALDLDCSRDARAYTAWAESAVHLNESLGLPGDLATFDRLFYSALKSFEGWNDESLLRSDADALRILSRPRATPSVFSTAFGNLMSWRDESESFADGHGMLARAMAALIPGTDASETELRLWRTDTGAEDLWRDIASASGWDWEGLALWPLALDRLLDAFPEDFLSWLLTATTNFDNDYAPFCDEWWRSYRSRGVLWADGTGSLTKQVDENLQGSRVPMATRERLTPRVAGFLARCYQFQQLCSRYRITDSNTAPFLAEFFGTPWPY